MCRKMWKSHVTSVSNDKAILCWAKMKNCRMDSVNVCACVCFSRPSIAKKCSHNNSGQYSRSRKWAKTITLCGLNFGVQDTVAASFSNKSTDDVFLLCFGLLSIQKPQWLQNIIATTLFIVFCFNCSALPSIPKRLSKYTSCVYRIVFQGTRESHNYWSWYWKIGQMANRLTNSSWAKGDGVARRKGWKSGEERAPISRNWHKQFRQGRSIFMATLFNSHYAEKYEI